MKPTKLSTGKTLTQMQGAVIGVAAIVFYVVIWGLGSWSHMIATKRAEIAERPQTQCVASTCDKRDLEAQVRSADAAEAFVDMSFWQLALGAVGTGFLAWTLQATRRSTRAAHDAIDQARTAMKVELRAYISPVGTTLTRHPNADDPDLVDALSIQLQWQNSGATPARNIFSNAGCLWTTEDIPDDFAYGEPFEIGSRGSVGPRLTLTTGTVSVAVHQIVGHRFFVYGHVDYDDVFAGTPRRRTEICQEIVFHGDPTKMSTVTTLANYGRFNGFDNDCLRKPTKALLRSELTEAQV